MRYRGKLFLQMLYSPFDLSLQDIVISIEFC